MGRNIVFILILLVVIVGIVFAFSERGAEDNDFEVDVGTYQVTGGPSAENELAEVWERVKNRYEVEFVASGDNFGVVSALIYVHPYSVGVLDPSSAEWIVIVSALSSERVRNAVLRLDYQEMGFKGSFVDDCSLKDNFGLDDSVTLMEEEISEQPYGVTGVSAEEVEVMGDYHVYSYPPRDFGGTIVVNRKSGKVVFYATTVWDGKGKVVIPAS